MTLNEAKNLIKTLYDLNVSDIGLVQDGYDNQVYKFISDHKTYAFRVAKTDKAMEDVRFEAEVYTFLHEKDFPTIRPIFRKEQQSKYFVYEWVAGEKALCTKDHKPDIELCRNAGSLLADLHQLSESFTPHHLPARRMDSEVLKLLSQKERFCNVFDNGEDFIFELEAITAEMEFYTKRNRLLHNDFRAQNLILEGGRNIAAVIDFDWACMGEPMKDVAHALVEWSYPDGLEKCWESCWQAFYEGYHQKIVIDKSALKYWVLFACLSDASSYLSRVLEQAKEGNGKLNIRSFMYSKFKYFKAVL